MCSFSFLSVPYSWMNFSNPALPLYNLADKQRYWSSVWTCSAHTLCLLLFLQGSKRWWWWLWHKAKYWGSALHCKRKCWSLKMTPLISKLSFFYLFNFLDDNTNSCRLCFRNMLAMNAHKNYRSCFFYFLSFSFSISWCVKLNIYIYDPILRSALRNVKYSLLCSIRCLHLEVWQR